MIETVDVTPCRVPTDAPVESDGTLSWDGASVVLVEIRDGATAPGLVHLEWFHDHVRIEQRLLAGAARPVDGALAARRDVLGHGLELDADAVARHLVRSDSA